MKPLYLFLLHTVIGFIGLFSCFGLNLIIAGTAVAASLDLTELSLEDLMAIEVITTLSRKEKKVSDTAAAVFVITDDDIRRSGATTIPDALRMVPGLEVARIDANKWAITARGFNNMFANKLQVLMDGRSVYTPLFSGVFWDVQDTMIEDIARIEVIRGPGASLWGVNAVNGVINIVTKPAVETQGTLVVAGTGSEEKLFGGVRYGGKGGESAHYRAYAKWFDRDAGHDPTQHGVEDQWHAGRAGGRVDWSVTDKDHISLHGDYYEGGSGTTGAYASLDEPYRIEFDEKIPVSGGNLLGRWQHTYSSSSELIVQTFYDQTQRKFPFGGEVRDTIDLDLQHRFSWTDRQEIIWGLGYRWTNAVVNESSILAIDRVDDKDENDRLINFFVQDEIYLFPQTLSLQIGSKFEKSDSTDWEALPNLRLLWFAHPQHTLWSSISRAVRTASLVEHNFHLVYSVDTGALEVHTVLEGNNDFSPEELIAYELGYRYRPLDTLSMDLALFFNEYQKLSTFEPETPYLEGDPAYLVLPLHIVNKMHGFTYGAELAVEYRPVDGWRLYAAYTYLEMELESDVDSNDIDVPESDEFSPNHQFSLRSLINIGQHWQVDIWGRYVDDIPGPNIPGYITMDARLGWRPTPAFEISLVGRNLLDDAHPEYTSDVLDFYDTEVQRSVYIKAAWRF